MTAGWIGVDLDGTLAHYEGWVAPDDIGKPIDPMLMRVKQWVAEGRDVRIFTARAWSDGAAERDSDVFRAIFAIRRWCLKYIGKELPITCCKDLGMAELWDDRAVQVEINTGRRVDGKN